MKDKSPKLPTRIIDVTELANDMEKNEDSLPELLQKKDLGKSTGVTPGSVAVLAPAIVLGVKLFTIDGAQLTQSAIPPLQTKFPAFPKPVIQAIETKASTADETERSAIERCVELAAKHFATELNQTDERSGQRLKTDDEGERRRREDDRWERLFQQCIADAHNRRAK
jgi:hypothetical protein